MNYVDVLNDKPIIADYEINQKRSVLFYLTNGAVRKSQIIKQDLVMDKILYQCFKICKCKVLRQDGN
jgi:hypothetical protein